LHQIIPAPGGITFITGPSGAGKTSLLRQLRGRLRSTHRIVEMNRIRLPARAMVDCFEGLDIAETLQCLSRVGLADVSCYVRKPSELSLGQRWRLRLAMAMQIAKTPDKPPITVLICDEFTALLDRVTACVVARSLRRCIGSSNVLGALVASSHDDLLPALQPDVIAHCDFGKVHTYHSRVRS
jgi:ABC-type ATPase with predicted acetyltransferase domain